MDLSIVIVNWKSRDYLDRAIASIEASVTALHYEVVVIDSGSFDGCGEMLARSHPAVTFIQSHRNRGFGGANNEALQAAQGEIVLFLNPDTEVAPAAIDLLYDALRTTPHAGIVGPTLLNGDGSVQETCIRAFPTVLNQVLDSNLLRAWFPDSALWGKRPLSAAGAVPRRVDAVSGACLMIRRSLFETVGGFGCEYFMYSEDIDLCRKVRDAGQVAYYVPLAIVVHHGGSSSAQAPATAFSSVMRLESQWRYFRKTRSRLYAALYRLAMGASSLARIAVLLLVWPLQGLSRRRRWTSEALGKWLARLRWTLGGERWVRDYEP